jgi:hypothetical protein
MCDHAEWSKYGLDGMLNGDYVEYINQGESGYGDLEGEWYSIPDELVVGDDGICYRVIFGGTFGNDHSPMCSHFTWAYLYDVADGSEVAAYLADVSKLQNCPEYLDSEVMADD